MGSKRETMVKRTGGRKMKNPFRTLKALVLNRRKDKVGKYIAGIGTIRTLIEKDLLFVDVKKPYVSLSLRLHLSYIDDEAKLATWKYRLLQKMGLVKRDMRYVAFMESVLAFINYYRGLEGLPMHDVAKRLDFMVMNMESTKPLLVGYYQNGAVDYVSYSEVAEG